MYHPLIKTVKTKKKDEKMFFALLLFSFFGINFSGKQFAVNDENPEPNPKPEPTPDTNFPHPTTAGVVVTMVLGITIIVSVVMPMCCMRQADDYLYDPSKPLLQTPIN